MNEDQNPYNDKQIDLIDDPTLISNEGNQELGQNQFSEKEEKKSLQLDPTNLSSDELRKLLEQKEAEEKQQAEKNLEVQIETLKTELEEWKKTVEDRFTRMAEIEKELESSKKEEQKETQQGSNSIEERFIRIKTFVYESVSEIITESNSTANIIKISNTANAILQKLDTF